jgi:hypothetical protein
VPPATVGAWTLISGAAFKPRDALSVAIFLGNFSAASSNSFLIDDIYFSPGELLLATGFEGATTGAFTSEVE